MSKPFLDSALIGPTNNEFDRIERAGEQVRPRLVEALERRGLKLHWSYGDSKCWEFLVGVPTDQALNELVVSRAHAAIATDLRAIVGTEIDLDQNFLLRLDLDSDERVQANEGWFFRTRTGDEVGKKFEFRWNGERLSLA